MSKSTSNPLHARPDWSEINLPPGHQIDLLRLLQQEEHLQRLAALGNAIIYYLTHTDTTEEERESLGYVFWHYSIIEPTEG